MDRSTRRRRLGIVAIVVAALAAAGTSSSPPPTPALSSSQEGTLTVTADAPVAWVDVAATEDSNLIAAQGQTTVRLSGQALDQGVFLIAEELGVPSSRNEGMGSAGWGAGCQVGQPCDGTVRLTAVLVDPRAFPSVDVQYQATAETRFPSSSGPVPTAEVDVDVSEVTSIRADSVGLSTTQPEGIHLGPEVPRAVRSIHLSLPAGAPADATLGANALVVMTEPAGDTDYTPDILVSSLVGGQIADLSTSTPLLSPFATCEVAAPCETDIELHFDWNGGTAEGSQLEWSLAAWPGVSAGEPAEAASIGSPVATEVPWGEPQLTSSTSGQTSLAGVDDEFINLDTALDLSDVPQRAGDLMGLLRLTVHASFAPGTDPAPDVHVSFAGNDYAIPTPGDTLTIYSLASDVTCGGRSVCPTNRQFSFGLHRTSADLPEATVNWTADVEFLPLGSDVPDGAKIDLVVASPPP